MTKKNKIIKAFSGGELGVLLLSIFLGTWLMFGTFSYKNDQFSIASKIWSDFAAHIPLIRSFSLGSNFPPEYPLFPNEPIRYHYLFYLGVGMIEKIGINIALSLNLLSILGFSILILMIFKITKIFFNSKKAGYLAVYLFLFNGSLSFVKYFEKNGFSFSSLKNIIFQDKYVSFGPWDGGAISAFWNLNIYTNQRHLAMGVGLFLFGIYPLLAIFLKKKYVIRAKIKLLLLSVFLFLPLIHQAGYIALIAFVAGWIGFYYMAVFFKFLSPLKPEDKKNILMYLFFIIISLIFSFFSLSYGMSKILLDIGFLSIDKSLMGIINFWFQNIGFYLFFIFLIPLWIFTKKISKKGILLFIFYLGFLSFFIIANFYKLSVDMINNHKFINIFVIGMNILVAGFLVDSWKQSISKKVIVVFLILFLTLSGIIDFFPLINDHNYQIADLKKNEVASWIEKNTNTDAVFLTTTYLYHPASLAGRKIFLDYGYFAWSLGHNDKDRRKILPLLFTSKNVTKKSWCDLMRNNNLDYVIISPGQGDLGAEIVIGNSFVVRNMQPEFISNDGYKIYNVEKFCYEKK